MRVIELARAGGVTAETVRHYTREGLLQPRRNPHNGYQLFETESLAWISHSTSASTALRL